MQFNPHPKEKNKEKRLIIEKWLHVVDNYTPNVIISRKPIKQRILTNEFIENGFTIMNTGNTHLNNITITDTLFKNNIIIYKNTTKLESLANLSNYEEFTVYSGDLFKNPSTYVSSIKLTCDELQAPVLSKIFTIIVDAPIYITDISCNLINCYNSNHTFQSHFQSKNPYSIVVDRNNKIIYTSDSNNNVVYKYDNNFNLINVLNNFVYPTGLFLHETRDNYNLYIVDTFNYKIKKYDNQDNLILEFGSCNMFDIITSVLVHKEFIYVTDIYLDVIFKFDILGNLITKIGQSGHRPETKVFLQPYSIAVDEYNFFYVVDTNNHRIQKFDNEFNFVKQWGKHGKKNGEFNLPHNIYIKKELIYVADTMNSRIQVFNLQGEFVTMFGSYKDMRMPYSIVVL
jgi:DNA-binding beta-propeller fold protein YncE